eukprot:PhF_6_TR19685/c0_g1_i1/m.28738/K15102/SLC25A3, PHC, PIC; solute carrier family 25 (mitochondrial phosphate transporter), member 3
MSRKPNMNSETEPETPLTPDVEVVQKASDRICWSVFAGTMLVFVSLIGVLMFHLWDAHGGQIRMHSTEYFILCLMGGVLSGLPHTILTPLDVVKCRMQVGEYSSMVDGFRTIWKTEGTLSAFYRGWAPTFVGYSFQGALKFGLYEYFKFSFAPAPVAGAKSHGHTVILFAVASACAELFADVALAPWEAVKVKMQTTRKFEPKLSVVMPRMWDGEGLRGFFKGLPPLWARQVPYTVAKFTFFEKTIHFIYAHVLQTTSVSSSVQLGVTLLSGYISGIFCALVSHPADTVITKINQRHDGGVAASLQILAEIGCMGVWRGVGIRILMIGTLTGLQWLIYDTFKLLAGLQSTGVQK